MDGEISLISSKSSKTEFRVDFPICKQEILQSKTKGLPSFELDKIGKVLVVDDLNLLLFGSI